MLSPLPDLLERLRARLRRPSPVPVPVQEPPAFTPRQQEIVDLFGKGRTVEQIAGELGIAPGTVLAAITGIRAKLHLRTRNDVQAWCIRHRQKI